MSLFSTKVKIISRWYMKKNKLSREFYWQLFFVILAFTLMVAISGIYAARIVKKQVEELGNVTVEKAASDVRTFVTSTEMTLRDIAFNIERRINRNESQEAILADLTDITNWLTVSDTRFEDFSGVYGVVRGQYLDGTGWIPPSDYIPTQRPWYIGALNAKGEMFISAPYTDAQTNKTITTASCAIYNANNEFCGVIAIDMSIDKLSNFVSGLKFEENGYGVLVSNDLTVLAHIEPKFKGVNLKDIENLPQELVTLAVKLRDFKGQSEFQFEDYTGEQSIAFIQEFSNSWIIGVILPVSSYNSQLNTLVLLMTLVASILMSILLYILTLLTLKNQKVNVQLTQVEDKATQYKNLAHIDALTGIKSRNAYIDKVAFHKTNLDTYTSFAIGVLDINNLKLVNDNLGHDIGDMYIKTSADYICNAFSDAEIYRIGGDEFVVIFIDVSEEKIISGYTRLKELFNEFNATGMFYAGISFGYEFFNSEKLNTYEEIFKAADEKMYKNKHLVKANNHHRKNLVL